MSATHAAVARRPRSLLVMLLLADAEARPVFSAAGLRLAGGAMSTTMPTARLGSEGRDRAGDENPLLGLLLRQESEGEPDPEEM